MNNTAQLISRNALSRDFLDLGTKRLGSVSYLMFMEKRTGRGLVAVESTSEERVEIVSEILFSKLKRKFSTRVFNGELAKDSTWELWKVMSQFANKLSIDGFMDLIQGDVPPEFIPSVSLAQLQEFLHKRSEMNMINHELNTHAVKVKVTTRITHDGKAVNSDFYACNQVNDNDYSLAA